MFPSAMVGKWTSCIPARSRRRTGSWRGCPIRCTAWSSLACFPQTTVQRGQLMTPYPQYPGVVHSAPGWGNSNYHSLQAKFTKRFEGGGNAVAAYTFSKLISDGSDNAWTSALWRNYYCRSCDKSLSPYDQRHRLIGSFTYEFPFGTGSDTGVIGADR